MAKRAKRHAYAKGQWAPGEWAKGEENQADNSPKKSYGLAVKCEGFRNGCTFSIVTQRNKKLKSFSTQSYLRNAEG